MGIFGLFNIIAVLYAIFAVGVVIRLVRRGRATFDSVFTGDDRRLVGAAVFYLVIPIAVALHELGHAVATWGFGGEITEFHFMLYWGYVVPSRVPPFSPFESATIALAGNAVSLAIGFAAIVWTVRQPINAAWNFARLELARIMLALTLVLYPILSLVAQMGDFWILRQDLNSLGAHAGDVALAAWGAGAIFIWWLWRKGPWKKRYVELATPLFDSRRILEKRLAEHPRDVESLRDLARLALAVDDRITARNALDDALAAAPDDPHTRYLAGLVSLRQGDPRAASEQFRVAGKMLEELGVAGDENRSRDDLRYEVTLALAAARLAMSDADGAALTAEAALEQRPRDARAVLVHADALVAAGRKGEAKERLEAALASAQGPFAAELRKRLGALPRTR